MNTTSSRTRAFACTLLAGTFYSVVAAAPAAAQAPTAPTFRNLDGNGVDLARGDFLTSFPEGSVGSGEAELALLRMVGAIGTNGTTGSSQWDHMLFSISGSNAYVDFGSRVDAFPGAESRGAALTGSDGDYQYRSADGTVIAFGNPTTGGDAGFCGSTASTSCYLLPTSVTSPDGKVVSINYAFYSRCVTPSGGGGGTQDEREPDDPVPVQVCQHAPRIASVTNSFGYEIRFSYQSGAGSFSSGSVPASFYQRNGASFYNVARSGAPLASVAYVYGAGGIVDIHDPLDRTWRVTSSAGGYSIRRPGASADTLSATLSGGRVTSVTRSGVVTNYSLTGNEMQVTQSPAPNVVLTTKIVSDPTTGLPISVTDPLNNATGYSYEASGLPHRVTMPEGNYVEYVYDSRGNVTHTRMGNKAGTATLDTYAAYNDVNCANPVTCNRPDSTTDARGNTTDYTYDPVHGGVTSVKAPAPAPNAVRPETRYSYTLTHGEYRLTGTSTCQTGSSCPGTSDEVVTTIGYDPDDNGNVTSVSTADGAGTLTATTSMSYDAFGNLETVDGPLTGGGDTTRYRYNAARQPVGVISPDPDSPGVGLKNRAVRNTYDSLTGLLVKVEQGNVDGQSDTAWAAFVPLQEASKTYDE